MDSSATPTGGDDAWRAATLNDLPPPSALNGVEREAMDYDVVIVGTGPAGWAAGWAAGGDPGAVPAPEPSA